MTQNFSQLQPVEPKFLLLLKRDSEESWQMHERCFRYLQIGKCSVSELMNHLLSFHLPFYIRASLKPCFWSPFPSSLPPDAVLPFLEPRPWFSNELPWAGCCWVSLPGAMWRAPRTVVQGLPQCPALAFELSSI